MGLIGDGIDVYGTLRAEGTSTNPIHINGSEQSHIIVAFFSAITFFPSSTNWNQQTNSGSLIENVIFSSTEFEIQSGIKISDNTFLSGELTVEQGSPTIINNNISTGLSIIQNPNLPYNATGVQPEISNNTITGGLSVDAGSGIVTDNIIYGITINDGYGSPVSTLIERNLITNATTGISCDIQSANNNKVIIENNTVTNNSVGIQIGSPQVPTIIDNNIYGNSYNAKLSESSEIGLPNNWWGTTDVQAINQTIYDIKYDFNLGTINFLPILIAPNPQATPNQTVPNPSPTPSPTSTSIPESPQVPAFAFAFLVTVILVGTTLIRKRQPKKLKHS
jgi:parallel beta-helix repeat protein